MTRTIAEVFRSFHTLYACMIYLVYLQAVG